MGGMFKVSNRVHDGLFFMTILARYYDTDKLIPISVLEKLGKISTGYMEEIIVSLRQAGLVKGLRGSSGGYKLKKTPSIIKIKDVIEALDGPVDLSECGSGKRCPLGSHCYSKKFLKIVQAEIINVFNKYTLAELIK